MLTVRVGSINPYSIFNDFTLNCASLPLPPAPAGLDAGVELLMIVCRADTV